MYLAFLFGKSAAESSSMEKMFHMMDVPQPQKHGEYQGG
jgi:hypothetical protein